MKDEKSGMKHSEKKPNGSRQQTNKAKASKSGHPEKESKGGGRLYYRSMFQENPSVVYIHDPDTLLITDPNPAACAFYGYPRQEMIGMHLTKITKEP